MFLLCSFGGFDGFADLRSGKQENCALCGKRRIKGGRGWEGVSRNVKTMITVMWNPAPYPPDIEKEKSRLEKSNFHPAVIAPRMARRVRQSI
jgi:hypothetical protein